MAVLARRDGVLEYELRKFSDYATSPFAGDPRPELESAWHELFLCWKACTLSANFLELTRGQT